jgi:hypothetical protein
VFSRDSLRAQCRQGNCLPMASLHGWYLPVSPPSRRVLWAIFSGDVGSSNCLAVPSHLVLFPGLPRPIGVGETVEARPPKEFSCCPWTGLGCGAGRGAGGGLPVEHPQHIFFQAGMPVRLLLFIRHVASGKGEVPAPFLRGHRGASGFG